MGSLAFPVSQGLLIVRASGLGVSLMARLMVALSDHHPLSNSPPSRGRGLAPSPLTGEGWDGGEEGLAMGSKPSQALKGFKYHRSDCLSIY